METQTELGKIAIAPEVLVTIARLTALAVPGVARLVPPSGVGRLLPNDGVKIKTLKDGVLVQVYLVADPGVNMLTVGRKVRAEITRALEEMVGVDVHAVDVHFEDVGTP